MQQRETLTIEEIRLENARSLVMSECGNVQARFGARLGLSRQLVNNYMGKTPTKNIGSELARRIESEFGRPIGWMDERHTGRTAQMAGDDVLIGRLRSASPLSAVIPALLGSTVNQLNVSREWMRRNVGARPVESMVLSTVAGDAMAPTLPDGALVLVDRSATSAKDDGIYMLTSMDARRREAVYFRRIGRLTDGSVRLYADSPSVAPEMHASLEKAGLIVLGRVVVVLEVRRL